MKRLCKKFKTKKILAILLLFTTVLSCFSIKEPEIVHADSNDRRASYIKLMGGSKLTDIDDLSSFTMNDLQVLALFLSNYYKPWATSLDDDTGVQEKITSQLVDALRNIGFDESAAKQMVSNVYSASLSSSQQVYVCAEEIAVMAQGYNSLYQANATESLVESGIHAFYYIDLTTGDWNPDVATPYVKADGASVTWGTSNNKNQVDKNCKDARLYMPFTDDWRLTDTVLDWDNDGKDPNEEDIKFLIRHIKFKDLDVDTESFNLTLDRVGDYMEGVEASEDKSVSGKDTGAAKAPALNITVAVNDVVSSGEGGGYTSYVGETITQEGHFCGVSKLELNMKGKDDVNIKGEDYIGLSTLHYTPMTVYMFNCLMSCIEKDELGQSGGAIDPLKNNILNLYNGGKDKILYEVLRSNGVMGYFKGENLGKPDKAAIKFNTLFLSLYSSCIDGDTGIDTGYVGNCNLNYELKNEATGTLSPAIISTYSTFTQRLYVDWVGNVICDVGDKRVIVYPACINSCGITTIGGSRHVNLVSSWGMKYYNKNGTTYEEGGKKLHKIKTDKIVNDVVYKQMLGKTDHANFDAAKGKWGSGEVKDYNNFLLNIGVNVNKTGSNHWYGNKNGGTIGLKIFKKDNLEDYSIHSFLVYEAIENANLDDSSCWKTGDLLTLQGEYFTNEEKFNKGADANFSTIVDFGTDAQTRVLLQHIFLTYLYAYNYQDEGAYNPDKHLVNMKFNPSNYPRVDGSTSFEMDKAAAAEEVQNQIMSFIYYLLHPDEGLSYVSTLFKNKVSGILIGWHEDIVGSSESNSTTGMTQYLGFTGYVTMPNLYDISWVSWLLTQYENIIVYLIILISLILVCYIIVGQMTFQRALFGLFMFGFLAFLPPVAINSVVNYSNQVCDTIYSSKFDYWALCQLQTYLGQLNSVTNADTVEDYVSNLMQIQASKIDTETGYAGVKVKWMSPKKQNELSDAENDMNTSLTKTSSALTNVALNTLSQQNSGESFLESDNALYLYRDYCDIYRYASMSCNIYLNSPNLLVLTSDLMPSRVYEEWGSDTARQFRYSTGENYRSYLIANDETKTDSQQLKQYIKDTSSVNAIRHGFLVNTLGLDLESGSNSYLTTNYNYFGAGTSALTLGVKYNKAYEKSLIRYNNYIDKVENSKISITSDNLKSDSVDNGIYFGLNPNDFTLELKNTVGMDISDVAQVDKDLSYFYYGLYSESPFYFFSYNTQDQMYSLTSYTYDYNNLESSIGNFKDMLLKGNQDYFFNNARTSGDGFGELRDFMNFHDLFYYIIPLLQKGNDLVASFDELYGMYAYEDINLKFNEGGSLVFDGVTYGSVEDFANATLPDDNGVEQPAFDSMTDEMKYKFWHNYNVYTIFNMYTTWLDCMNDCDYAKSEKIYVAGEKYTVSNPLDPTSYYEVDVNGNLTAGRYMVFSESERKYYGLEEGDLTQVERKLIDVARNVYKESLDLMNYYTLSDEVLIQAFAMTQLFEFNKEFSQTSLISKDYVLYPQSYELKAFTYDAYLRLIISGSTGDSLMVDRTAKTSGTSMTGGDSSSANSDDNSSDSSESESSESDSSESSETTEGETTSSINIKDILKNGLDTLLGNAITVNAFRDLDSFRPTIQTPAGNETKQDQATRNAAATNIQEYEDKCKSFIREQWRADGTYNKGYSHLPSSDYATVVNNKFNELQPKVLLTYKDGDIMAHASDKEWMDGLYQAFVDYWKVGAVLKDQNNGNSYEANHPDESTDSSSDSGSSDSGSNQVGNQVVSGPVELSSLYYRVIHKTSLFFGIVLLLNDFIAVYIIPALKLFFLVVLFFLSVAMIIAEAFKLEFNFISVVWKSLLAPLLAFSIVSIGMAWIVSLFMTNGADSVTKSNIVISMGDPTMVLIVMTVINAGVVVLYWKICKKCFADLIKYGKAVFDSSVGAVAGALSKVGGVVMAGKAAQNLKSIAENTRAGGTGKLGGAGAPASSAEQRGRDNDPKTGKAAGAATAGAVGGLAAMKAAQEAQSFAEQSGTMPDKNGSKNMNKYDAKGYDKLTSKQESANDKYNAKMEKLQKKYNRAQEKGNMNAINKFDRKMNVAEARHKQKSDYVLQQQKNIKEKGRIGALSANLKLKAQSKMYSAGITASNISQTGKNVRAGLDSAKGNIRHGFSSAKKGVNKFRVNIKNNGVKQTGKKVGSKMYNMGSGAVKNIGKALGSGVTSATQAYKEGYNSKNQNSWNLS